MGALPHTRTCHHPASFPPSWPQVRSKASDSSHHFKTNGHLSQALQASIQARRPGLAQLESHFPSHDLSLLPKKESR